MSSLLAKILAGHGFEVRTAADVSMARAEINDFDPDMLLLDVSLGEGPTGIHLAHAVYLSRPDIAMLVFTRHSDISSAAGADMALPPGVGFLRKHMVNDEAYLIEAMEKVLSDQGDLVAGGPKSDDVFDFLGSNGSRTLRLLASGYDNEEIARRCGVSRKTVERWVEQVYRDLGIDTKGSLNPRVAAVRHFYLAVGVPSVEE